MKHNKIVYAFIVASALSMNNFSKATDPRELLVLGGGVIVGTFVLYKVWRLFDTSLSAQVSKAKLKKEKATLDAEMQLYLSLKRHMASSNRDESGLPAECKPAALKYLVTHPGGESLEAIVEKFDRMYPKPVKK